MRSIWRTLDRGVLTGIAAICLAVAIIGVSYGATAVTSGFPTWLPMLMSVAVVAGGSEFVFLGILTAGGSLIAAVLAGLLVNARHVPYGLSVPDVVGTGWRRLLGTHVMNDESVAMALSQPDRERRRAAYWLCGLAVVAAWPIGAAIGAELGSIVPNPNAFGLDAVFPAVLISLVLPALRDPATRTAALAGAAVAALATPFLGAGIPVLLALTAVLLVVRRAGKTAEAEADSSADPEPASAMPDTAATAGAGSAVSLDRSRSSRGDIAISGKDSSAADSGGTAADGMDDAAGFARAATASAGFGG
ncbi:AzlC family ABC transporter permease [Nocardia sp. NPDC088792]|uniref:AzlC family ABC transporter permease n=1 Tax=Nocardia sp. NPDC088792 TaxID=3364332 RepID=UPI003820A700